MRWLASNRVVRVKTVIVGRGTGAIEIAKQMDRWPRVRRVPSHPWEHEAVWIAPDAGIWPRMSIAQMGQAGRLLTSNPGLAHGDPAYAQPFMNTRRFAEDQLREASKLTRERSIETIPTDVIAVKKWDTNCVEVTLQDGSTIEAGQVFIATGAGPQRGLEGIEVRGRPAKPRRPFDEITSARNFLFQPRVKPGQVVVIPSGSPSAIWVSAVTFARGGVPLLVASEKYGGFATANPAGRNSRVLALLAEQNMFLGSLAGLEFLERRDLDNPLTPGLGIWVQGMKHHTDRGGGRDQVLYGAMLVYSNGADPWGLGGPLQIIDPATVIGLLPLLDRHNVVSGDPGATAFGLGTADGDVMVVGAAGAKSLEALGHKGLYESNASLLPIGARVNEGIGMSIATTRAAFHDPERLATMIATERGINFYLATKPEISAFIRSRMPGGGERHYDEVAAEIIKARQRPECDNRTLAAILDQGTPSGPILPPLTLRTPGEPAAPAPSVAPATIAAPAPDSAGGT